MIKYRNVRHGREVLRPYPDEWLEASAGWVRVEAVPPPKTAEPAEQEHERSND